MYQGMWVEFVHGGFSETRGGRRGMREERGGEGRHGERGRGKGKGKGKGEGEGEKERSGIHTYVHTYIRTYTHTHVQAYSIYMHTCVRA